MGEQLIHDDEDATLIIGDNSATLTWDRGIHSEKLMQLMKRATPRPVASMEHHPGFLPGCITFTFHYEPKKVTL